MAAAARRSFSTKVTCAAPRDSASRPSAPLPANKSSTRALVDARLQPVEQGFPHAIRRRANLDAGGKAQAAATMPARDDAQDSRVGTATRVHHDRVIGARGVATFSAVFAFRQCLRPRAPLLATFWGPSVRYRPNTTSSAHRSARRGNATGLILRKQNSEERTHEEAILQPRCLGCHRHGAGCSSSVGQSTPDVQPTDPTTGNGNPAGGSTAPAPAATAALFQPAQGIFPFPNDLYFSGTTDGTINIQPANGLIPNQVGLNALDGWSTTAPIRIRFGGALESGFVQRRDRARLPGHRQQH